MRNYFKSRYFKMSYMIYILVLGALVVAFYSLLLYRMQQERADKEQREANAKAELMVQILDEKFSMIDQMAIQISQSTWKPYVSSQSDILYSRVDYFKRKEICQQLETLNVLFQISNSTALVFPYKDLVVDGDGFWEVDRYLKHAEFDEKYRKILVEKFNSSTKFIELVAGEDDGDFVVIRRLTTDGALSDLLFVVVDGKYFKNFLNTNMAEAVCFELYYDGETLYSSEQTEKDAELIEIKMASSIYPWEYAFHIQKIGNANPFIEPRYIVISYLGIVMAVLILSYLLARLTYQPIVRMVKRLGSNKDMEFYGLEQLELMLQEQQIDKEHMEELGNRYYHMGLNNFLISLLSGTYEKENVGEYAKGFHTDFKEKMVYLVIVFVMDEDGRKSSFLDIMLKFQMMSLCNKITAVMCNIEGGYAMILGTEECEEKLMQQREQLNTYLDEYLPDHDIALYAGEEHIGFRGIYYSYLEAQESLRRRMFLGGELYYYYPIDEEIRMINQLRNGNFQEVRNILCKLETENRMRELLPETERKLIDVIQEVFKRFIVEIDIDVHMDPKSYLEMYEQRDIPGLWGCLREQVSQMEEGYHKYRLHSTLGRSLVEYVNENFTCSELSQQSIADYFGVARPTVSKTFKETTNMNFVDYLHKQRVAHAKMLVQAGNYDVLDVGRKSGYENEVTFKRAFVKHEGITPREYVKCCRNTM